MSDEIIIHHDGDTWRIIGFGATRSCEFGPQTFCHLASTTRFSVQRNGKRPVQICEWIDAPAIESALMQREEKQRRAAITAFYTDRANGAHAAKAP